MAAPGVPRPSPAADGGSGRGEDPLDLLIPTWPDRRHRLDRAAQRISETLGGDTVAITLVTGAGEFLDTFGVHNPDRDIEASFRECVGVRTRLGDGFTTRVAATGEPLILRDAVGAGLRDKSLPRFRSFFDRFPVQSLMAMPISYGGEVLGVLHLLRHQPAPAYAEAEIEQAGDAADRLALAIHASSLPDELVLEAQRSASQPVTPGLFPLAASGWGIAIALVLPILVNLFYALIPERPTLPSAVYMAVIVVVAALAGPRPALIAGTINLIGLWFIVLPPKYSFVFDDPSDAWGLVLYVLSVAVVVVMVTRLERAGSRLVDSQRDQAAARERELAAEIAVRNAQARADSRFRSLVEATSSLVWSTDAVGAFVAPQGAWEAYTAQSWEEQAGFGWLTAVHPDDRTIVGDAWRAAVASGEQFEARGRLHHGADSTYRWFVARAVPIHDNLGAVIEWIGTMTDVHEAREAQTETERTSALLGALTNQAPVGFGFLDTDLRYRLVNDELAAINGFPVDAHLGRRPTDLVPDLDAEIGDAIQRVASTGEPILNWELSDIRQGEHASRRDWIVSYYPVRTVAGTIVGVGTTVVDVTERNRLLEELSDLRTRLDALADTNVLAIFSGEDDRIIEANGAFLSLIGYEPDDLEAGRLRWTELTPAGWEAVDSSALEQLRTSGRAEPYEKAYVGKDGHHIPILVGIAALSQSPFRWIAFAADLTERKAAEDLLNIALAERDQVARTLQASLLPPELPPMPDVALEARYLASSSGGGIGGDFYDVFRTGEHEWNIVIGDVCGKGVDAAALTALARHTLRAAAIEHEAPADILQLLNQALLRADTAQRFCTTAYGKLSPVGDAGDRWRLTLALGGHHQPRLLRDGQIVNIGRHGSLVGIFDDATFPSETVELRTGDRLIWFTDGLIEQPGQRFTEEDLGEVLVDLVASDASAPQIATRLTEVAGTDTAREDDVAILVMEFGVADEQRADPSDDGGVPRREFRPDARSVREARAFATSAVDVDSHTEDIVQLLVSELASNAVLHASTPFSVSVRQDDHVLRVEVEDNGRGRPVVAVAPLESPSGRGLRIVESLADRWGVDRADEGKVVWFELDR